MMEKYIQKASTDRNLTRAEAREAMEMVISARATDAQIAGFLIALAMKEETPTEIASFAEVMNDFAERIEPKVDGRLVDVCGTGGDALNTFNISTTAMFVVAAAGISVAKHGNRSVTSKCGSADVLEELGANLSISSKRTRECTEEIGIGFMLAPLHHVAMKNVMPVRNQLGVRTVFNILGPLTNPANSSAQLMGVFNPGLTEKMAETLKILGKEHAMVVYGEPGLDEISNLGKTKISELSEGNIRTYFIKPGDFGLSPAKPENISGGDRRFNAKILEEVLRGDEVGYRRDIVLLNAAAGIAVGDKAEGLEEGLSIAEDMIESGKAYKKLNDFIRYTR